MRSFAPSGDRQPALRQRFLAPSSGERWRAQRAGEGVVCRKSVCETILAALDGRLSESVIASDLRFLKAVKPAKETR